MADALLPPGHMPPWTKIVPLHLAPLCFAIASLAAAVLLGTTVWKPTLGARWPLAVVQESPLYAYPFSASETVPYGSLMLFAVVFSVAWCLGFEAWAAVTRVRRWEVWLVAWCGCWESYTWTVTITQLAKVWIQEPRPDFRDRCWPDLQPPFPSECLPNVSASVIADGLQSFPSGHSSTAGSLGVYLSAYAMWCAYGRRGGVLRRQLAPDTPNMRSLFGSQLIYRVAFIILLLPFVLGAFVGGSRIYDWRHHPWDVTAGFGLGGVVAACMLLRTISELERLEETAEATR